MKKKKRSGSAQAAREKKRLNKLRQMLEQRKKKAKRRDTAQKTIPFERMYKDGICKRAIRPIQKWCSSGM